MTTIIEAAEIINKEFAGCNAYVDDKKIEVSYRGKKNEEIIIENGSISYKGTWQIAQVAGQIADRLNLVKNF